MTPAVENLVKAAAHMNTIMGWHGDLEAVIAAVRAEKPMPIVGVERLVQAAEALTSHISPKGSLCAEVIAAIAAVRAEEATDEDCQALGGRPTFEPKRLDERMLKAEMRIIALTATLDLLSGARLNERLRYLEANTPVTVRERLENLEAKKDLNPISLGPILAEIGKLNESFRGLRARVENLEAKA